MGAVGGDGIRVLAPGSTDGVKRLGSTAKIFEGSGSVKGTEAVCREDGVGE